jgi:hypothetical protein
MAMQEEESGIKEMPEKYESSKKVAGKENEWSSSIGSRPDMKLRGSEFSIARLNLTTEPPRASSSVFEHFNA